MGIEVYCDLDEVIVDWSRGALALHGTSLEALKKDRGPGPVGALHEALGMSFEKFWDPLLSAGTSFWRGLEPTTHGGRLIDSLRVRVEVDEVYFVTSPTFSHNGKIHQGKVDWVSEWLGRTACENLYITKRKDKLAGPGRILIDDYKKNVQDWRKAGGRGIIYPTIINGMAERVDNPVERTLKHLDYIAAEYRIAF